MSNPTPPDHPNSDGFIGLPPATSATTPPTVPPTGSVSAVVAAAKRPVAPLAIAALAVGGSAFLFGLIPGLGILLALAGLALGAFSLARRATPAWMSAVGVAGSSIALVSGVIVIAALAAGGGRPVPVAEAPEPSTTVASKATPTPTPPAMVQVPNLVGMTMLDAYDAIKDAGLVVSGAPAADWVITGVIPAPGTSVEKKSTITVTANPPAPPETISQVNARRSATSYLSFTSFSRSGLIDQLLYEGYSVEDATYGVDAQGADWFAQAALKAADYLEFSSFSRNGLYDQLIYEGFSPEEAQHGVTAVGY